MRTFYCDRCGSWIFFENTQCLKCGGTLGFLPDAMDLGTLEPDGPQWRLLSPGKRGKAYRQCANWRNNQACNWMIPADDGNELCEACRLNQVIPDLSVPENRERWHKLEKAKRRVLYTLKHIGLPVEGFENQQRPPLRFSFMADPPAGPKVLTGHAGGLITVNLTEADDATREKRREEFHELYRTLLGHLRHETGHYYWDLLIAGSPQLEEFRKLFGDETRDYPAALQSYYRQGPPADWNLRHVSAYASSHPWEDFAETFAHYLHIEDMVETAAGFGVSLRPNHPGTTTMTTDLNEINELDNSFDRIFSKWVPLTNAVNELNRGMGLPDVYPFVLSDTAVNKLRFIHNLVQNARPPAGNAR